MQRGTKLGLVRLFVGFVLNVALWLVYDRLAKWGGIDREFRFNFIGGALALIALVAVIPVFWRGDPSQAPFAFLLMGLPGFILFCVVTSALRYLKDF